MKLVSKQHYVTDPGGAWGTWKCQCGEIHAPCLLYDDHVCDIVLEHRKACFFCIVEDAANSHDDNTKHT